MQEEIEAINRRTFLRFGASGLAAAGSGRFLPRLVAEQAGKREAPAKPVMLRYTIEGSTIHVTLEDVLERAGFELISIAMPSLVCVDEEERDAWLAHGDAGGDVVVLREAKDGKLGLNSFWGEINGILPVIMAGHSGAICVQETTAFMDGTLLSVTGEAPNRRACLGTTK